MSLDQATTPASKNAQIDIQKREVVMRFPNRPTVKFSLDIPDLRCAGRSPTYTYKAWVWCAYVNALHAAQIKLGFERNHVLFRQVWKKIKRARKGLLLPTIQ
jgi:hypothetical protein